MEPRAACGEEEQEPGPEAVDPVKVVHVAAELARDNPHTAMAGALALGFLLGGGLTPRLLVSLAALAARRYAAEAAREALADVVRRPMDEVTAR